MWCGSYGPPLPVPLRVYHHPENLRRGEPSKKYSATSAVRKTQREKKLFGRQKSTGEIPSQRGVIIAIVTVIELDFIGIIIIITNTIITTPSRCNILG
jgi:hypothetical protein